MSDWRILLGLKRLVRQGQSIGAAYDIFAASAGLPKSRLVEVYCRARVKRLNAFATGKRRMNTAHSGDAS